MFKLEPLPFSKDAFGKVLSIESFDYHYEKHHKAYLDKLNELLPGTEFEKMSLDEIVMKSSGVLFNQAAQHWNHTFFWNCLNPGQASEPSTALTAQINKNFGSLEALKKEIHTKGMGQFGSGWVWLCKNTTGDLVVTSTANAENPLKQGLKPLMVIDVWEHAYYIDYRNARAKFLDAVLGMINWNFVSKNF